MYCFFCLNTLVHWQQHAIRIIWLFIWLCQRTSFEKNEEEKKRKKSLWNMVSFSLLVFIYIKMMMITACFLCSLSIFMFKPSFLLLCTRKKSFLCFMRTRESTFSTKSNLVSKGELKESFFSFWKVLLAAKGNVLSVHEKAIFHHRHSMVKASGAWDLLMVQ